MSSPPNTARNFALELARIIKKAGHDAMFAGGCVRDALLGRTPKDYDIVTSARPNEVLELFPGSNEVGAHFGVIIVSRDGQQTEIATYRNDGSYSDNRRPDSVEFTTAEHDAQRRDFTINGLFEDPENAEIIDYVGGRADLDARILRAIGDPTERFQEDALRMLRAVRFASHLEFEIEPHTRRALSDQAHLLDKISPERIRDEFSCILTSSHRRCGIQTLTDSGLIMHIIPELQETIGCDQPPQWHPEGDVYVHTLIMLEMLEDDAPLELCLAVLLHDIGKPLTRTLDETGRIRFNGHDGVGAEMARSILNRLRYPNRIVDDVVNMVARHMKFMHVQQMRTSKLKRFMAESTFEHELELHRVDCASSNGFTDNYDFLLAKRDEFANEPLIPDPLITGKDLIEHGLSPSPRFKEILETIQTEQLEGRILDRKKALAYLETLITDP